MSHESHHHHHHHSHHHPHHHHVSRRQAIGWIGAAGLAAIAARPSLAELVKPVTSASTAAPQSGASLFNITKVTESVYAAIAKPQTMINCNASIFVTADHVLVVDSHSKPSAAQALIAQIRKEITTKPVRYCINSHFHWDHAQGNTAYPNAFGKNVDIVASTATRDWLSREGAPRLKLSLSEIPKRIADLRARADKEKAAAPLLLQEVAQLESYQKEMKTLPIALPTITFDQRLVLHHGGKEIHLMFLGRGHTAGDVVTYLPEEKIVATGDLMHSILPYCADGYPEEWPRTLSELEKLDFTRVVSGHGSVQEGKSTLAFFRSYIEDLNEGVARGVERGASLAEIQSALAPEKLRSIATEGQMARITREAQGFLGPNAPPPAVLLKGAVADNVTEIYNYYTKRKNKA